MSTTRVPRPHGDPEPRQLGRRGRRPVGRVHRQDAVDGLDELDARVLRPDRPEVGAQRVVGDLAQGPGQLDARRPAAHEDEGHPLPAPVGVRLALGRLERDEDAAPDLRGVVDGLETRCVRRPLVVPEVAVPGAGRDDERVVREVEAVPEPDLAGDRVDPRRLAQQDRGVALLAEDRAQRLRDLARRQGARRHLVEQRLEQVVVPPVDQRHGHPVARLAQLPGRVQAAEPAAHDDDAVRADGGRGIGREGRGRHRVEC